MCRLSLALCATASAWVALLSILTVASPVLGDVGPKDGWIEVSPADWPIEGMALPPAGWPAKITLPAHVQVLKIAITDNTATVDLDESILVDLTESLLTNLFKQFSSLFWDLPEIQSIRLTCGGRLLSSYLDQTPVNDQQTAHVDPQSVAGGQGPMGTQGLGGISVTLGPSHGLYFHSELGWTWQRSDPCVFGEAVLEDTNSIRLMQFAWQYLAQDGAVVHVCRELNEANCCHSTGNPWWRMAARYWLEANGIPSWVWNSAGADSDDDIRARPLYSDYRGTDIYIAHHTNAGGGGAASGTEVYRDTAMEHPEHESNSYNLALQAKSNIEWAIRDMYDGGWPVRNGGQPRDSNGGFGEIRIPSRPACLIELAFHDNCSKDAQYLTDSFFRSVSQWGLYKGVCAYFGRSPTWDRYSCEVVSENIPAQMDAGQSYSVTIRMRNRGVLWKIDRGFRLGAGGNSDPFGPGRVDVAGEVRPGAEFSFNFTMTAPASPGIYYTDWQMLREGFAWFGPIVGKNVEVKSPTPTDGAQLVSDSVPTSMTPGQVVSPTLTFTNNGTSTWSKAAGYRLGAVGDSDPFMAVTRIDLADGETIAPGQQKTFVLVNFTAPGSPNTYTTDWRMIHEGADWFGSTFSKNVAVAWPPVVIIDDTFDSYPDQAAFEAAWPDTANSAYYLNTAFGNGGKSVAMPSPGANFQGRFYRNLGGNYNGSDAEPLVFQFQLYLDPSGVPNWGGARHYCEIRGYAGGSFGNGELRNLMAVGMYNTSGDTWVSTKYQGRVLVPGDTSPNSWRTLDEDGGAPTRAEGWHNMQIVVTSSVVKFYVDGQYCEQAARPHGEGFDSVVLGSDATANGHQVHVDNLKVMVNALPPSITQQPMNRNVCAGGTTTFSVQASSALPLSYRWQRNNTDLDNGGPYSNVTTSTLTVTGVSGAEAGDYRCKVTNAVSTVISNAAGLSIMPATEITQQPQSQSVDAGTTAVFSVTAAGSGTISYQWQKDGQDLADGGNVSGAQSAVLEIANVGEADIGTYRCIVTADCGQATSNNATLSLAVPPTVTAAVARKIHGSQGAFAIDVAAAGAIECRNGAPPEIIVTFGIPIDGLGGLDNTDVSIFGGSVGTVSIAGAELTVTLSSVTNGAALVMAFPGIVAVGGTAASPSTVCFGVMVGDVTGDGATNIFDLVTIRNHLNTTVNTGTFRNDITVDGNINVFDLVVVRNSLNTSVAACP